MWGLWILTPALCLHEHPRSICRARSTIANKSSIQVVLRFCIKRDVCCPIGRRDEGIWIPLEHRVVRWGLIVAVRTALPIWKLNRIRAGGVTRGCVACKEGIDVEWRTAGRGIGICWNGVG